MDEALWRSLLAGVGDYAARRRSGDAVRTHALTDTYDQALARFRLDDLAPHDVDQVIAELITRAEPGLAAITSPRFFGWVMGASHPVGVAADWLTSAWGQNAGNHLATTSAAAAEEAASAALLELLDLPATASVGFVTGATMANFTCLCAARGEVLRRVGWDVEADGLFGAPPIRVVVGEDAHSTVFAALKYAGLGAQRVIRVATDEMGAMRADAFEDAIRDLEGPILVIAQAGQINSGAFDPFSRIIAAAHAKGAWVHVDGAFGLWARAAPTRRFLTEGVEWANSWAVDGHKWLQTPYDCGYAIVRDAVAHRRAMRIAASYLPGADDAGRNPSDYTPELSRRARGFATWAMIRYLGRAGVEAMIERGCALARRIAERLAAESDISILNDVVLNQVAVRLGADLPRDEADRLTKAAIARIQREGECFLGGADWRGQWIVRLSITGGDTTEADIDRAAHAIIAAWRRVRAEV